MAARQREKKTTRSNDADEEVDNLFVGSVKKAFLVLEAFGKAKPMMGFSQIAREVGLEKSATQRAAHTLWKLGYLDKIGPDGEYRLSMRCLDIGQSYLESHRIVDCARPYLKFLRRKTDASINLTMLDDVDTVFVVRYVSPEMLSNDLSGGLRLPAYCTATGIAMMSALQDDAVRRILDRSDLKPILPNTIWQPEQILERVRQGRKDGYVLGVEEDFASDITIACAIQDPLTGEVAAIGASYSSEATSPEVVLKECRQLMIGTAKEISARLAAV
ncbi:IclR family transcriptional regulator [Paraburkholderia susongensis]|uniref:Transcriptional regulator, IclR family n=1 Tax=Paraburkholderia susongensis TaxID=1515439 RepID=A0A1X7LIL1_9BURK|nr:IclR family transcriptional regulator [Paraburkholderia susongensis]SMG53691.1 transcriptional regulator, IclR family [Paraburkholderia susongensis]